MNTKMKISPAKTTIVVFILLLVGSFFYFDLGTYLSFEYIKSQQSQFQEYYRNNSTITIAAYFVAYILVTALSLPGAAIMTLLGGALFGLGLGVVIVSFASTIGATLAFLAARFLLRESIQKKFGDKLQAINDGVQKEGAFYLFTMRLIPAFPFFIVNLVMGLTPIKTIQFFFVSQIGMLPGTAVYVNAGTQLAQIESAAGILSPKLLASFVLLGLFPLVVKKIMALVNKTKIESVQ